MERSVGADHPEMAFLLDRFADALHSTRKFAAAEPLLLRAHQIRETCFGPSHPETISCIQSLVNLYKALFLSFFGSKAFRFAGNVSF